MFRGAVTINIDAKGRMAMPMRFRDMCTLVSAGKLVITIDTEEACLMIYPLPEWELIQAKLEQLPSFNPEARRIQRLLIGHATDVELDGNGRILLPAVLRDYAQLEKKAILLGQGKKIELWSESLWNDRRDEYLQIASKTSELPDALHELSL
ncbi:MAG: cell division/cell wall cluster transcriptional repressor MraZ [Oceanospirillaceae bacterium]|nr:cell division/cell wall cluster transcriptional repressor MraZ [Oceanospirillaceae bacterium]HCI01765.1 cell division/cell wall cluster transcriptional repressor MraZ [Oceanospirillaceae bacterium]